MQSNYSVIKINNLFMVFSLLVTDNSIVVMRLSKRYDVTFWLWLWLSGVGRYDNSLVSGYIKKSLICSYAYFITQMHIARLGVYYSDQAYKDLPQFQYMSHTHSHTQVPQSWLHRLLLRRPNLNTSPVRWHLNTSKWTQTLLMALLQRLQPQKT